MNKSAPAGNILRKQISLLPKYHLTMTPKSNDKVSIQLILLNHAHLADNMDQLTAGDTHKCHIVVGDSENHILLLTSFKDKDLIGVYNGTITYEITRKHDFEHKVFVRCISSQFVGLDVQSEYLFKSLEPLFSPGESISYTIEEPTKKKMFKKQTTITDTFKERKRKCSDIHISPSKEKKKRDSAIIDKFRHLKKPFGNSSIGVTENLQKPVETSNKLLQEMTPCNKQVRKVSQDNNPDDACEDNNDWDTIVTEYQYPETVAEDLHYEQNFIADEHFDNILSEIENEISKSRHTDGPANGQKRVKPLETTTLTNNPNSFSKPNYKLLNSKRPLKPTRCNYSFIDLLQRNEKLSDNDDTTFSKDGGFSDTIKSHVEKFIIKTSNNTNIVDPAMTELISNLSPSKLPDNYEKAVESCTEYLKCQNNKTMDKSARMILKTPIDLTIVPEELVTLKEHDVDITAENSEVTFGTRRPNKDITQMAMKVAKNKHDNDFIPENKSYKANLVDHVNQSNNFKNVAENIKSDMFVDQIKNKTELAYITQDELQEPCDLKKFDHSHHKIVQKCQQNNDLKIRKPEQERNASFEESEVGEFINDFEKDQDSHEKNIPKTNLALIPYDNNFKQMCANNNYKTCNQLMLPDLNTMSMNMTHGNNANLVDKLNRASILKSNRLEKQPILYLNKPFNETKQSQQPLLYNTPKQVNTNILPSIWKKSPQKTKNENRNNFKLDDDTMRSAVSKEASASFSPLTTKNEKYVNTYSFSTTKIDVQTQNHADVHVQIIRKLKVDLDITEILTREHEDEDIQKNKGNTTQTSNRVDNGLSCANELPNYSQKRETSDKQGELWPKFTSLPNPIDEMCVQEKSMPKIFHNLIDRVNEKEFAIVQEQKELLEKSERTEDFKGRVENILEKYSKILRNNGNLNGCGVTNYEIKGSNLSSNPAGQASRPYKMQDINKLDISFPITIINSDHEVVKPKNNDFIARLKALKKQNNGNVSAIQPPRTFPIILQDVQEKTTEHVEDFENTALDGTLNKTSNLETVDFGIDQSMFNPKTLLQCLSTDTGIVPPPVQFSDDIKMNEIFGSPAGVAFEENNDEYPYSIFDKNSHEMLTPTKEIETWTLSQDDSEYKSHNLKDSCTVMHINLPITSTAACNVPQNIRKAKLDQFTYKVKSKLKM